MDPVSRRTLTRGTAWAAPAVVMGAPAALAAGSCQGTAVVNEALSLTASNIYSSAPKPGKTTVGNFILKNGSPTAALPPGLEYTITWHIFQLSGYEGDIPGYQSYVTTATAATGVAGKVTAAPQKNAFVGSDGTGGGTLTQALGPGESLNGTWSGTTVTQNYEAASLGMRYYVTLSTPTKRYSYESTATDAAGCVITTLHNVDVTGGTWTYDNGRSGI